MKKKYEDHIKHATQTPDGGKYYLDGFELLDPAIDKSRGLGREKPFWYVTTCNKKWLFLNSHPVIARKLNDEIVHIDYEIVELVELIWAHGIKLKGSCQDYTAYCKPEESKLKPTPDDKRYLWLEFDTPKDMNQLNAMLMPMEGDVKERYFGNVQPQWTTYITDENNAEMMIPWCDYQYALERLKEYEYLLIDS